MHLPDSVLVKAPEGSEVFSKVMNGLTNLKGQRARTRIS